MRTCSIGGYGLPTCCRKFAELCQKPETKKDEWAGSACEEVAVFCNFQAVEGRVWLLILCIQSGVDGLPVEHFDQRPSKCLREIICTVFNPLFAKSLAGTLR